MKRVLSALFFAVAVPSLTLSQNVSPAGVVRRVSPPRASALDLFVRDSSAHNDYVSNGAAIGAVAGGVSGAVVGLSLNIGCTPTIEGGDPGCSVARNKVQWALIYGMLGTAGGALVGAVVGKLLTWL